MIGTIQMMFGKVSYSSVSLILRIPLRSRWVLMRCGKGVALCFGHDA